MRDEGQKQKGKNGITGRALLKIILLPYKNGGRAMFWRALSWMRYLFTPAGNSTSFSTITLIRLRSNPPV